MDFTNLRAHYHELLVYLQENRYTEGYIRRVRENILWILKNEMHKAWQSYVDIYNDRVNGSKSHDYKRNQRVVFGAIQQFDLYGEYPTRKLKNRLIKRGAYHQLMGQNYNTRAARRCQPAYYSVQFTRDIPSTTSKCFVLFVTKT